MKILLLTHRFPYPPAGGAKVRAFHMIEHLGRAHDVTVAAPVRSAAEERESAGIGRYCSRYVTARVYEPVQWLRMATRLPTPIPSSMGYFHSSRLAQQVNGLLDRERFDLILVHCSSVAHYVAHRTGVPKLLDFVDMDSQKWLDYSTFRPFPLSAGYRLEGRKLERAERGLARRFDLCTTITRAELATLDGYGTGVPADWFPNGVDNGYFAPASGPYDPDTICFVGRMDYYPNQECMFDFCANVLPRIQERRPGVKLLVVGADPSPAVRKLGELPGVTVTGSVPDVRPYLHRSALMVAPLNIARGTQNKILEAMSAGVPVVVSRVAAGGVDALSPDHFLVAGTAEEHAAAVLRILGDGVERRRLAEAGRARVLSHHEWGRSMQRLDRIIARCLAEFDRGAVRAGVEARGETQTRWPIAAGGNAMNAGNPWAQCALAGAARTPFAQLYGGKRAFVRTAWHAARGVIGAFDDYRRIDWRGVSRIVFICKGNICRSPYAEWRWRALGGNAASAGLEAAPGKPANVTARQAAARRGIDLDQHRARLVTGFPLRRGDLLVAFEPDHAAALGKVARRDDGVQLTLLALWSTRPSLVYLHDPYGLPESCFDACFGRIDDGLAGLLRRVSGAGDDARRGNG